MRTPHLPRSVPALLATLALATAALAGGDVGTVKSVEGEVMVSSGEGEPFAAAEAGAPLREGGVVVVMEDSAAVLQLAGKGEVTLADMASLKLEASPDSSDYSTVTGVRAPVLFLFPTGQSAELPPGRQALTFGIHHDLEKIAGISEFQVHALHEDDEAELEGDSDAELLDASRVVARFTRKAEVARAGYTWYSLVTSEPLDREGEYALFLVGKRGAESVKLGQSTLVFVEEADD